MTNFGGYKMFPNRLTKCCWGCVLGIPGGVDAPGLWIHHNGDDDDDDEVYADNTTAIVASSVVGAVALIALVCAFQYVR